MLAMQHAVAGLLPALVNSLDLVFQVLFRSAALFCDKTAQANLPPGDLPRGMTLNAM